MMWQEFLKFDLRYQLRQPLLWLTTLPLMLIAFLSAGSDSVRIGGAIGNIHLNAPVVIANQLSVLSIIAMILVTFFIAGTVLRDSEVGISDMLFATPMRKIDYLFGRFFAGLLSCLVIFALITLAMMLGSSLPSIDPARVNAFSFMPYAWSFLVFVLPNLLFVAALLMLLAATTRSMIMVYVGVLAFLVLWSMAGFLRSSPAAESIAVLLDPFGIRALKQITRYYSSADSNTQLPGLSGALLFNRLLWTGIAIALFAATVALFKPQRAGTGRRWFGQAAKIAVSMPVEVTTMPRRLEPDFGAASAWQQWWSTVCFDTRGILKSLPFLVMLLLAMANFIANVVIGGMRFDSVPYPLTRLMLEDLSGGINSVLVIILIFFSGELIFRERQVKIAAISDALPVSDRVQLLAKCAAIIAVIFSFLFTGVAVSLVIQLFKGGAPVEALLYVKGTFINSVYFILMAIAILALHIISNNKFLGYGLAIALFGLDSLLNGLNLNHRLYNFASLPTLQYSDVNGYGHFLTGWSWYAIYWGLFCAALVLIAQAFWIRGLAQGGLQRSANAWHKLRGNTGLALAFCLAAFGATGSWIFYNTNVLNRYEAKDAALDRQAEYENKFRQHLGLPHPSIVAVRADVDIFPAQRQVAIKATYVLQNKTTTDLDTLRIQTDLAGETTFRNLPAHSLVLNDQRFGYSIIKLKQPLTPGATLSLDFTIQVRNPGFTNSGEPDTINYNGTMFTIENFFPHFGYDQTVEISDRNERRKRGLGEPHVMPKLDDRAAQMSNFWKLNGVEADFIDFEATVSTSADQMAIAPGKLEKSWEANGRRYFHYRMEQPIEAFFSFQSGQWDVKQADWQGLPIQVFYDRKHPYNVDSMISGAQKGLQYMSENYGAYPLKDLCITEFPLYQNYARAFPGLIPFSESLGFINDIRDSNAVDHVFYVTAHEVAHQWWGDQIVAANVQGSGMVTESLAEYSALMTVEKQFGAEKVRHILRFDLDDYLRLRGAELVEEQPLFKTENQVYIQYRKGSLIMYRLREEIGEAALNRALKRLLDEKRYQTTPYITSRDVLAYIRAETPPDKQELITDMFERIVFYDNRIVSSSVKQRSDGQWDVTMAVHLAKTQADGKGVETPRDYDEPVDIAVFARVPDATEKDERILYRAKRRLPAGDSMLTITVKEKPFEVGVDPYNLLIDRNAADNRKRVDLEVINK